MALNRIKQVGLFILLVLAAVGVYMMTRPSSILPVGGVSRFSEYMSTSTRNAFNGTATLTNGQALQVGAGTLGTVTITGLTTGIVNFYDETTTAAHSDHATTTLATFPASTATGSYVFDILFTRGLVYEISGTVPTSTITWRQN